MRLFLIYFDSPLDYPILVYSGVYALAIELDDFLESTSKSPLKMVYTKRLTQDLEYSNQCRNGTPESN